MGLYKCFIGLEGLGISMDWMVSCVLSDWII